MSKELSDEGVMALAIASVAMHAVITSIRGSMYTPEEVARAAFKQAKAMVAEAKAQGIK
jgi:hypothetical protein